MIKLSKSLVVAFLKCPYLFKNLYEGKEARKYALEQHIPAYLALGLNVDRTVF